MQLSVSATQLNISSAAPASGPSTQINAASVRESVAVFNDWESLVFNDRLYSVDEAERRDGEYLVDVLLAHDGRVPTRVVFRT